MTQTNTDREKTQGMSHKSNVCEGDLEEGMLRYARIKPLLDQDYELMLHLALYQALSISTTTIGHLSCFFS